MRSTSAPAQCGPVEATPISPARPYYCARTCRRSHSECAPKVEILVANAGGNLSPPGPVEEIDEERWRATVDANLTATFLTIKCFVPAMKARGVGSIVTSSSTAARRPHPSSPIAYAAAKAGIQLLTQDVALQAGRSACE